MPGIGRWAEPGSRSVTPGSGLIMMPPVSVCHHVSTIGALAAADVLAVPEPRLGVDRLADRAEQPQRRQVELRRDVVAPLHERPDRGGRGVEDRDLVLLDDLPPAALVRGVGRALVDHLGRAVGQRSVDDVGVAGHPADVGGAPVDVGLGVHVVDDRVRVGRLRQVAARRVEDALRLPRGARRVEDEQRVLAVVRRRPRAGRWPSRRRRATRRRGRRSRRPRPWCAARRGPSRRWSRPRRAASTAGLSGAVLPRRNRPSAVMTTLASASAMRVRSASAENPPKTTECGAPMRAQASIAATASGIIGR